MGARARPAARRETACRGCAPPPSVHRCSRSSAARWHRRSHRSAPTASRSSSELRRAPGRDPGERLGGIAIGRGQHAARRLDELELRVELLWRETFVQRHDDASGTKHSEVRGQIVRACSAPTIPTLRAGANSRALEQPVCDAVRSFPQLPIGPDIATLEHGRAARLARRHRGHPCGHCRDAHPPAPRSGPAAAATRSWVPTTIVATARAARTGGSSGSPPPSAAPQ